MTDRLILFYAAVADQGAAEAALSSLLGYSLPLNLKLARDPAALEENATHVGAYAVAAASVLSGVALPLRAAAAAPRFDERAVEGMLQSAGLNAIGGRLNSTLALAGRSEVLLDGVNEISATVEYGPPTGFKTLAPIRGRAPRLRLESGSYGSGLRALFSQGPMVNVTGARGAWIERLWFEGAQPFNLAFTKNEEGYWGPTDARNPHAAITMDNETDGSAINQSSALRTENIGARNLEAFYVSQPVPLGDPNHPAGLDANGDFPIFEKMLLEDMKFCFVSSNSQNRNFAMRDINAADVWTFLTDQGYGMSRGWFGGPIDNCSLGSFVKYLFVLRGTAAIGPMLWTCLHGERLRHIGKWTGNTASEGAHLMISTNLNFDHNLVGGFGVPGFLLEGSNNGAQIFRNARVGGTTGFTADPRINDVRLLDGSRVLSDVPITTPVERRIASSSCHIYAQGEDHDLKVTLYEDGGTEHQNIPTRNFKHGHVWLPHWVKNGYYTNGPGHFTQRRRPYSRPIGNFTIDSVVGRIHTITMNIGVPVTREAWQYGVTPGGYIQDRGTGTILWIYSITGNTLVCKAMTHFDENDVMLSPLVGNLDFYASGHYTPSAPVYGKLVRGSATIEIWGEDPTGVLSVGDMLAVYQLPMFSFATPVFGNVANDDALAPEATRASYPPLLASVSRRELTISGCVSLIDHPMLELPVWVRPPPANEVPS